MRVEEVDKPSLRCSPRGLSFGSRRRTAQLTPRSLQRGLGAARPRSAAPTHRTRGAAAQVLGSSSAARLGPCDSPARCGGRRGLGGPSGLSAAAEA